MGKTKDNKNCRTCLNSTNGLQLLSKNALKGSTQTVRKSYADLLKDVAQINIQLDNDKKLPKAICRICIRRLIAAYEFVQQAKEVNQQFWNRFNAEEACLKEDQMEYTVLTEENSMDIKVEEDDNSVGKSNANMPEETEADNEEDDLPLCEVKLKIEENAEIKIGGEESSKDLESDEPLTDEEDVIDNSNLPRREKNRIKRMKGQQYFGLTKHDTKRKPTLVSHRQVGPTCSSSYCIRTTRRHCQKFDEETRKSIFKMFWNMTWEAKRQFAKKLVEQVNTKSTSVQNSKRQCSFIFKLPYKEESLQVCQSMFLSTLSLNISMVKGWVTSTKPILSYEESLYKCEFCEKICLRNSDLTQHRRIHTGEKPFSCNLCDKSFRIKHLLKVHVLNTHSTERPYKCTDCDKSFKVLKHFTVHKRVHTGEKPYMCDSCGGKYRYTSSLNFHRLTCDPTKNNSKTNKSLNDNNVQWYDE